MVKSIKDRLLIFITLIYMCLTFLLPYNKVLDLSWQNDYSWYERIFSALYFSPSLICILIIALVKYRPPISIFLNRICSEKIIYAIFLPLLIITLILTYWNITGLWWAWLSFGLQICTILITYILLKNRIQRYEAIMVGLAFTGIAMGIWEIPYQCGLVILTYPADMIITNIIGQTQLQLIPIISSIGLLIIINRGYNILYFNKLFFIFFVITLILYIGIFLNGFHLDMFYDWDKQQYIYTNETLLDRILHKGSKVTLALCLIGLVYKKGDLIE